MAVPFSELFCSTERQNGILGESLSLVVHGIEFIKPANANIRRISQDSYPNRHHRDSPIVTRSTGLCAHNDFAVPLHVLIKEE